MIGFITERDLEQAEHSFPGIQRYFATLAHKPLTFLELLARFEHWCDRPDQARDEVVDAMTRF